MGNNQIDQLKGYGRLELGKTNVVLQLDLPEFDPRELYGHVRAYVPKAQFIKGGPSSFMVVEGSTEIIMGSKSEKSVVLHMGKAPPVIKGVVKYLDSVETGKADSYRVPELL